MTVIGVLTWPSPSSLFLFISVLYSDSHHCSRSASASPLDACSHHHPHRNTSERWRGGVSASTPDITQRQRRRSSTPVSLHPHTLTLMCSYMYFTLLWSPNTMSLALTGHPFLSVSQSWIRKRKRRKTRRGRTKKRRMLFPKRSCWRRRPQQRPRPPPDPGRRQGVVRYRSDPDQSPESVLDLTAQLL